ncbi:MAG: RNA 2',3'-cyclic phosphodiesterase, partial [Planctomycetes bacterium]|nr:RNA 2',3'-cyclic phosphodiesterase [Planctomycetota bacterium]
MAWRGAQPRSFRPELNAPGDSVAQRRFLAIELPPPARAALAEVQAALEGVAGLRWSDPEQAHVTLRFLGDLPTPTSELVERLLAESGPPRGVESLRLALGPVGTFGRRNPRVVWVGVEGPDRGALRALGERFAGHPALGSPATRPFLPHVTVGRARGGSSVSGLELSAAIEGFVVPRLAFEVHELVLFSSSHGRDAGPVRHEVEARVSLSSFAIGSAEPSPSPVLAEPLPEPTAGETRPLGPDEQSFRRYLRDYLAAASSRSLPSPLAASDLLWAARLSSELALPWPPSAALVEALFAEPSSADERARASRRLADQAEGAARRVRLGLDQARALLEDVADDGVAEQIVVSPADVTRWVERHGLPLSWLA